MIFHSEWGGGDLSIGVPLYFYLCLSFYNRLCLFTALFQVWSRPKGSVVVSSEPEPGFPSESKRVETSDVSPAASVRALIKVPPLGRLGGIALSSTLSRILCSSASGRRKEMVLVEWWWVNSLHWWVSWVIKVPSQYHSTHFPVAAVGYPLPLWVRLSTPLPLWVIAQMAPQQVTCSHTGHRGKREREQSN